MWNCCYNFHIKQIVHSNSYTQNDKYVNYKWGNHGTLIYELIYWRGSCRQKCGISNHIIMLIYDNYPHFLNNYKLIIINILVDYPTKCQAKVFDFFSWCNLLEYWNWVPVLIWNFIITFFITFISFATVFSRLYLNYLPFSHFLDFFWIISLFITFCLCMVRIYIIESIPI